MAKLRKTQIKNLQLAILKKAQKLYFGGTSPEISTKDYMAIERIMMKYIKTHGSGKYGY